MKIRLAIDLDETALEALKAGGSIDQLNGDVIIDVAEQVRDAVVRGAFKVVEMVMDHKTDPDTGMLVDAGMIEVELDGDRKELIDKLGDVWLHVGAARDNGESIDADWIQKMMLECKAALE